MHFTGEKLEISGIQIGHCDSGRFVQLSEEGHGCGMCSLYLFLSQPWCNSCMLDLWLENCWLSHAAVIPWAGIHLVVTLKMHLGVWANVRVGLAHLRTLVARGVGAWQHVKICGVWTTMFHLGITEIWLNVTLNHNKHVLFLKFIRIK